MPREKHAIVKASPASPAKSFRNENEQLLALFLAELTLRNFSPLTITAYQADVRLFLDFIGSEDVTKVSTFEARRFIVWLAQVKRVSASTRQRTFLGLRSFFRFLVSEKRVRRSPFDILNTPKATRRLPRPPSIEEICRVIESEKEPKARAILETLYSTGCRVSELASMKIEDIHWREKTVLVTGKGRKERRVPLGEPAIKTLRRYLKGRHEGYVFLSRRGRRMQQENIGRIVRQAGMRAGFPGLHPHLLRHSFATHLLQRGANIVAVGKLLGHEHLRTTQPYTHLLIEDLVRVHKQAHPEEATNAASA